MEDRSVVSPRRRMGHALHLTLVDMLCSWHVYGADVSVSCMMAPHAPAKFWAMY